MRLVSIVVLSLAASCFLLVAQPGQIVFPAKNGSVTLNHESHVSQTGSDCSTCHDRLFSMSREPINFKADTHRTAESEKTSCGACHNPGGPAFGVTGNCARCHMKN